MSRIIRSVIQDAARALSASLEYFYPARNKNGFNERNLTYQMAKAFEKRRASCAFMEIPFFNEARSTYSEHIDALMLDARVALFVESKRLFRLEKMEELRADYERMTVKNLGPVLDDLCLHQSTARSAFRVVLAETWSPKVADWWLGKQCPLTWDRSWLPGELGVIPVKIWKEESATLFWLYGYSPLPPT